MLNITDFPIIAAVRTKSELNEALHSQAKVIFDLSPDLLTIGEVVKATHEYGKKLFIHLDLATGIGKDKSGLAFTSKIGVDGIISTRVNIIKLAREVGLFTVQRFFVVDSHSAETTIESIKASKPDMIEIMPGVKNTVSAIKNRVDVPIIAGGLINTNDDVKATITAGAMAVSTGNSILWN